MITITTRYRHKAHCLFRKLKMHILCLGLPSAAEFTHHCYYDSSGEINQEGFIAPLKSTSHTH